MFVAALYVLSYLHFGKLGGGPICSLYVCVPVTINTSLS